ncbi:hypothetical protein [Aurantimonas sp. DM33-3]|uniref:hypothetical protein n=1 Tax=Aurantimonas sp. DM33-3 TaxID=2766955 RepID=UPI0032B21BF8
MASKKTGKRSVTTQLSLAARGARTALSQRLALLDVYPGQDAVLLAIGEEDGIPCAIWPNACPYARPPSPRP